MSLERTLNLLQSGMKIAHLPCILMNLEVVWPFYAGVLVQAVFLLTGKFERMDLLKLLGCCAGSLIGLLAETGELLLVACIFPVIYVALFREKILQRLDREILMVWTLIGLYVALQTSFITDSPVVIAVLSVLSAIPIINAFAGFDKGFGWKVYFYMWFLVVLVFVAASRFAFLTVATIFGLHRSDAPVSPFTALCLGMSFLYLAANFWYVVKLCPFLPDRDETMDDRMDRIEDDMQTLAGEYDDGQVRWWKTLLLLAVCGFLLAANYLHHFINDETLVPFLIVLLPVMDKIKPPPKPPVQTIATADMGIKPGE